MMNSSNNQQSTNNNYMQLQLPTSHISKSKQRKTTKAQLQTRKGSKYLPKQQEMAKITHSKKKQQELQEVLLEEQIVICSYCN